MLYKVKKKTFSLKCFHFDENYFSTFFHFFHTIDFFTLKAYIKKYHFPPFINVELFYFFLVVSTLSSFFRRLDIFTISKTFLEFMTWKGVDFRFQKDHPIAGFVCIHILVFVFLISKHCIDMESLYTKCFNLQSFQYTFRIPRSEG